MKTEKSILDMTPEEMAALPANYNCMVSVPGRYYYGLGFVYTRPGAITKYGGDILSQLWRYDGEPETWHLIFRVRTYGGANTDPWGGEDRKMWRHAVMHGPEIEVGSKWEKNLRDLGIEMSLMNMSEMGCADFLIVKGDSEKMTYAMMHSEKDWIHKKFEKK